ncbi:MAG: hypothetical protein PHU07_13185 [Acidocella sp.]|nr:hypothetical protein [Acidocella sp.]
MASLQEAFAAYDARMALERELFAARQRLARSIQDIDLLLRGGALADLATAAKAFREVMKALPGA